MGRDDDVGPLEQRRLGDRLRLEHVERGPGDMPRLRASASATVSTNSTRAAFTMRTPGRIFAISSAPTT